MNDQTVKNAATYVLRDIVYGWRNSTEDAHTVAIARAELERREATLLGDPA